MNSSALTLLNLPLDTFGVILEFAASIQIKMLFDLRLTCHTVCSLVKTNNCFINWLLLKKQVLEFQQQYIPAPIVKRNLQDYFDIACKLGNPIYKQLKLNDGVVIEHCQNHAFRMAAEHGHLEIVQDLCLTSTKVDIHDDFDYAIASVLHNKHIHVLQFLIRLSLQPADQQPYNFRSQNILSCIASFATPSMFCTIYNTYAELGKSMDIDHEYLFNVLCHVHELEDRDLNKIEMAKCLYGTRAKPGLFKLNSSIINWNKAAFHYSLTPHPVLKHF
jgi:hypothetical protein